MDDLFYHAVVLDVLSLSVRALKEYGAPERMYLLQCSALSQTSGSLVKNKLNKQRHTAHRYCVYGPSISLPGAIFCCHWKQQQDLSAFSQVAMHARFLPIHT